MELTTCSACQKPSHKCDHGSLHSVMIDLRNEIKELSEWKAEEQRALVRMSVKLLDMGYEGDGVDDGLEWLCDKLIAYQLVNKSTGYTQFTCPNCGSVDSSQPAYIPLCEKCDKVTMKPSISGKIVTRSPSIKSKTCQPSKK